MCRSIVPNINYVKHNTRLTKRLEVEMGKCIESTARFHTPQTWGEYGCIVEQKGANMKQWLLHFGLCDDMDMDMDAQTLLIRQLKEKNIESVDVEFTFSARYPYKPPFMRVIYPRIIVAKESIAEDDIYSGIDDNGGGICTGLFNSSGEWSPVTSMLNVGVYIRSLLFCSPHLQLHPSRWMEPYSEMDALREYSDVLSTFTLEDAVELM
jgi:ubiquitin-conjugating enzyme E2 Q